MDYCTMLQRIGSGSRRAHSYDLSLTHCYDQRYRSPGWRPFPLQSKQRGDKRQRMPYALCFYLYLLVAGVVGVVIAVWLSPLGLLVNIVFAVAAAYLTIIIGRRVLGRKQL